MVDSSSSVTEANFKKALEFIKDVVRPLEFASGKTRVSLITYNDEAIARFYLDTYKTREEILHALNYVPYTKGSCFTADALRVMREDVFKSSQGDRTSATNIGVLITDGVSNVLPQETKPEARKARREGIQLYALSVGVEKKNELQNIIDKKSRDTNMIELQTYNDLGNVADTLLDAICTRSDDVGIVSDQASQAPQEAKGTLFKTNFNKIVFHDIIIFHLQQVLHVEDSLTWLFYWTPQAV